MAVLDGGGKSHPDRNSIPGPSSALRVAVPTAPSRPSLAQYYTLLLSTIKSLLRTSVGALVQLYHLKYKDELTDEVRLVGVMETIISLSPSPPLNINGCILW